MPLSGMVEKLKYEFTAHAKDCETYRKIVINHTPKDSMALTLPNMKC
jgi:hypothetical protein